MTSKELIKRLENVCSFIGFQTIKELEGGVSIEAMRTQLDDWKGQADEIIEIIEEE